MQTSKQYHCMCRDLSEVYLTLSSSGSSQWDLLQMVCEGSQLEALLISGDFIALPLGSRPSQTNQVSPCCTCLLSKQVTSALVNLPDLDTSLACTCARLKASAYAGLYMQSPSFTLAASSSMHGCCTKTELVLSCCHW